MGYGSIELSDNEWSRACTLRESYWLYVVFDCATPQPRLVRIRDPFGKLLARSHGSTAYTIAPADLMEAAEPDEVGCMTGSKRVLIIAGPNGAGKTTFATEFLPNEADCPNFINADLIAAGLSPFRSESTAVRAGKLMLNMIEDYVRRGGEFLI